MEDHIRANAELVRTVAREQLEIEVNYDESGVRWLDGYIDGQRRAADDDLKRRLPSTLGSFLGECIRATYGGRWVRDDEHGWSVRINERVSAFPFNKVQKQLAGEDGESVLAMFVSLASLI